MKKIITVLLTIAAILSSVSTLAESMPIEGKVISTQSYPIVSPDDKHEFVFGIVVGKSLQRVPCVRWTRQMKLVVAGYKLLLIHQGLSCQFETDGII